MAAAKLLSRLPAGDRKHVYHGRDGKEALVGIAKEGNPVPSYFRHTGNGYERLNGKGAPAGSLPLYNLSALAEHDPGKSVIVVGEEKTADQMSLLVSHPVVTWPGSIEWVEKADYTPLNGRKLLIVSDTTETARYAMRILSDILWLKGSKNIRSIYPPTEGMKGFSGTTLAEWINECIVGGQGPDRKKAGALIRDLYDNHSHPYDPGDAFAKFSGYMEQATKERVKEDKSRLQRVIAEAVSKNPHFEILGRFRGEIAFQLAGTAELIGVKADSITKHRLIQLADIEFWRGLVDHDVIDPDDMDEICNGINRVAQKRGMVNLRNLRGRGAIEDRSDILYHLGNRLLKEDATYSKLGEREGSKHIYVEAPPLLWSPARKGWQQKARRMSEALEDFNFRDRQDWLTWVGWIGSALLCGIMPWRVHLWLTGESQAGKSWLMRETAMRLMGDFIDMTSDYTEAAISRLIQSDALPLLLDESEPGEKAVHKVLGIIKTTAQGDAMRLRSQSSSASSVFMTTPRATLVLASTQVLSLRQAEASRMEMVHLKPPNKALWPSIGDGLDEALGEGWADDIRHGLILSSRKILEKVREVEKWSISQYQSGSRRAKIAGMIFAGAAAMGVRYTQDDLVKFIGAESTRNDNEDLLSSIMDLIVEVTYDIGTAGESMRKMTVHEMLADCVGKPPRSRVSVSAARYGMRMRGGEDKCVLLAPRRNVLSNLLERQAGIKGIDIGASLRMIEGVTSTVANFNNSQHRCLRIPEEVMNRIGYFFYREAKPDDIDLEEPGE